MIKLYSLLLIWVCTMANAFGQYRSKFPYQLTKADIPKGFSLAGPFTKEEKALSLSANQGIVINKKLVASNIYDHMDTRRLNRVFVASYIPSKHAENGLIVYILEYKSKMNRIQEQVKLPHDPEGRYMVKDNYLFIIGADANDYPKQVNELTEKMKSRWQLTEIKI